MKKWVSKYHWRVEVENFVHYSSLCEGMNVWVEGVNLIFSNSNSSDIILLFGPLWRVCVLVFYICLFVCLFVEVLQHESNFFIGLFLSESELFSKTRTSVLIHRLSPCDEVYSSSFWPFFNISRKIQILDQFFVKSQTNIKMNFFQTIRWKSTPFFLKLTIRKFMNFIRSGPTKKRPKRKTNLLVFWFSFSRQAWNRRRYNKGFARGNWSLEFVPTWSQSSTLRISINYHNTERWHSNSQ